MSRLSRTAAGAEQRYPPQHAPMKAKLQLIVIHLRIGNCIL